MSEWRGAPAVLAMSWPTALMYFTRLLCRWVFDVEERLPAEGFALEAPANRFLERLVDQTETLGRNGRKSSQQSPG